ncbi:cytochrome c [Arenibaculum sp.]|jgi:mono/diheme cytochrome c family protein|uniref:c-type cytochrome n=1 Tax=Arenibaculum sp. TaxID=2865862 RepID=UPI002E125477|nr:cytochrome c [Arenibaculum sp.]
MPPPIAFATAVLAVIASIGPAGAAGGDADAGRRIAEEHCAWCHAVAGPGPGPVAQAPAFSSFGRNWPVEALAEALAEGIVVGHSQVRMPEFVLSPEAIEDLLAYLASVQE